MRSKIIEINGKHYIAFWDSFLGIGKPSFLDPISVEEIRKVRERFRKSGINDKMISKVLGKEKYEG